MGSYNGGANRGYYLTANVSWGSQESANNRTYCYVSIDLHSTNQYFQGYSASGRLNVEGSDVQYYGGNYSLPGYNSAITIGSWEGYVYHDANGYGQVDVFSDFDTSSSPSYLPDYVSVSYAEAAPTNYDRKPTAPTSVTATVNADKTVSVAINGVSSPAGAATYYVSYSQNGGGFTGTQSGSGTSYTFSGLTPGSSYVFRAYATNSDGTGASTDSSSTFIPSGGKRYNGTAYVATQTAKRFDGTSFVTIVTAKRYDGTSWVNLT
jgi:hypothetical protein